VRERGKRLSWVGEVLLGRADELDEVKVSTWTDVGVGGEGKGCYLADILSRADVLQASLLGGATSAEVD